MKVRDVHELLLFIVHVAPPATVSVGKVVLAVPPMVFAAPLNVTVFAPPFNVPPLFVQLPATVTLPARITVMPEFNWILPNVIAAVGVTVEEPVKIAVLVALSTNAPVLTVKLPPKFMVSPALVVKVPPDLTYPPIKLIAPAAVIFWIVPPV